ncbi:MAG TPA: hypothetical protein VKX41_15260 [Alloacidobacterium sp.]|jgi:hypothetical protein|nr:hypothetical protein [Alloacidobacterium sp.]
MEADWSVEIGPGLPMIAVPWEGYVPLKEDAFRITQVPEAVTDTVLAQALRHLNAPESPVFTSKCDRWHLPAAEIDPFEFDAPPAEAYTGVACYIDIILRHPNAFASFAAHESWMRAASSTLREVPLLQSRTDFVIRQAIVHAQEGFGITLYVASCARNQTLGHSIFEAALNHAITVTIKTSPTVGE